MNDPVYVINSQQLGGTMERLFLPYTLDFGYVNILNTELCGLLNTFGELSSVKLIQVGNWSLFNLKSG
jgi:hypothetical protein